MGTRGGRVTRSRSKPVGESKSKSRHSDDRQAQLRLRIHREIIDGNRRMIEVFDSFFGSGRPKLEPPARVDLSVRRPEPPVAHVRYNCFSETPIPAPVIPPGPRPAPPPPPRPAGATREMAAVCDDHDASVKDESSPEPNTPWRPRIVAPMFESQPVEPPSTRYDIHTLGAIKSTAFETGAAVGGYDGINADWWTPHGLRTF